VILQQTLTSELGTEEPIPLSNAKGGFRPKKPTLCLKPSVCLLQVKPDIGCQVKLKHLHLSGAGFLLDSDKPYPQIEKQLGGLSEASMQLGLSGAPLEWIRQALAEAKK